LKVQLEKYWQSVGNAIVSNYSLHIAPFWGPIFRTIQNYSAPFEISTSNFVEGEVPAMFDFDWDDANRAHLAEHNVTPDEAEQVMLNDPLDLPAQIRDEEERSVQIGETDNGRILLVITTWRRNKLRVVTAFPPNRTMRRKYMERRDYGEAGSK
jgi:uncharacterized DUF497 family protein